MLSVVDYETRCVAPCSICGFFGIVLFFAENNRVLQYSDVEYKDYLDITGYLELSHLPKVSF